MEDVMRLFRGIRQITTYEDVEVFAETSDKAREKFEDDDEDVKVMGEGDCGYEVSDLWEVKE